MNNIRFCPFTTEDHDAIKRVMNTCFSFQDYAPFASAYEVFTKNYDREFDHHPQVVDRLALTLNTVQPGLNERLSNPEFWAGIDLPILLTEEQRSGKTIFIVGEDPLRNSSQPHIVLSTPYGTHLERCRKQLYWNVAEGLIAQGYNVYYTDINKLWLRPPTTRNKVRFKGDIHVNFVTALHEEIAHFKPCSIITYGRPAEWAIREIGVDVKVINVPHPKAWKSNWEKLIGTTVTDINKINYILQSTNAN